MTNDDQSNEQNLDIDLDEDIRALVPAYLENRKKDLASLKDALNKKDITIISKIAHNIKGTALSYGQLKLDVASKILNDASKNTDWKKIESAINEIEIILRIET